MIRNILSLIVLFASLLVAFDRAAPGYEFEFPRDHFEHSRYEIEWWYYTGNVKTADDRRFGYELTFFRFAIERDEPAETPWDVEQVYIAHFALSDIETGRFHRSERLNRAGPGLAGASLDELRIWNGNWSSDWTSAGDQTLFAITEDVGINFELDPLKPPVINGVDGISRKSEGAGGASHYVTFTRLATTGEIRIDGERFVVEGTSWMDHEFSTDSMGLDQQGWDWMSIQLGDDTELMLYGLRGTDGSHDEFSSGTFVGRDGVAVHLDSGDFTLLPGRIWRSPDNGAEYPVEWRISVPSRDLELTCRPLQDNQEIPARRRATPTYWEGAVVYEGTRSGKPITGVGYLEMTGYDKKVRLGL